MRFYAFFYKLFINIFYKRMEEKLDDSMDKIVLLCCVGRSGSTTMQRILNTIPNSNICGENYGAIFDLLRFYKNIKKTTNEQVIGGKNPVNYDFLIEKKIKPAWYNSYKHDEVTSMIKFMIMRLFKYNNEVKLWGFKEIRCFNGNIELIEEFKELFPQTKVILLIRENIRKQSQSGWFKDSKNSYNFIMHQNENLINFFKNNKSYCYFMTFERMFAKLHVKGMFNFIGCSEHFDEQKIIDVLNNKLEN